MDGGAGTLVRPGAVVSKAGEIRVGAQPAAAVEVVRIAAMGIGITVWTTKGGREKLFN